MPPRGRAPRRRPGEGGLPGAGQVVRFRLRRFQKQAESGESRALLEGLNWGRHSGNDVSLRYLHLIIDVGNFAHMNLNYIQAFNSCFKSLNP